VNSHLLLEAAVRSMVMGAIVFVVLRVMRIDQIRARRTAWLLALVGALAMPALVGAQIGPRLLPDIAPTRLQAATHIPPLSEASNYGVAAHQQAPLIAAERDPQAGLTGTLWLLAVISYCVVAAVLLLRLCAGVGLALRLRNQAERVIFPFDPELDVRVSPRIRTPVTIGSSVLLPGGHTSWDGATLRIVLSHERAHIRQSDFYVHALAGLHCALFWFNPFSWWLHRQLCELGEALSDYAGVEQAESRASYAETLLAFATRGRAPVAGMAMASASNLAPRIERLLSDRGFERSFAVKRRLSYVAAGVVMLAMVATTSMVRVHAAPANQPLNADTPTSAGEPTSSDTKANTQVNANTNSSRNTDLDTHADTKVTSGVHSSNKSAKKADVQAAGQDEATDDSHEDGVMAINTDHSNTMFNIGNLLPSHRGDYIYFQHHGKPYLIQDAAIIAQAQAMLAPMKALSEQRKELGLRQRELALRQASLGAQQSALAARQLHAAKIDTPEFKRDMAELKNAIKDMHLDELTAQVDRNALAEVQRHLAEIQAATGKLGADLAMQDADFGAHLGVLGESQGQLGEQQGKLGEQQARLEERQREIAEGVRRQLKPIIEQAIREGKGDVITEP
jgi:beta-lactamase regulating signal transducer with metallopeptidase domain